MIYNKKPTISVFSPIKIQQDIYLDQNTQNEEKVQSSSSNDDNTQKRLKQLIYVKQFNLNDFLSIDLSKISKKDSMIKMLYNYQENKHFNGQENDIKNKVQNQSFEYYPNLKTTQQKYVQTPHFNQLTNKIHLLQHFQQNNFFQNRQKSISNSQNNSQILSIKYQNQNIRNYAQTQSCIFIKKQRIPLINMQSQIKARSISPYKPKQTLPEFALERLKIIGTKNKFEDEMFPSNISSLYCRPIWVKNLENVNGIFGFKKCKWQILKKIYQKKKLSLCKYINCCQIIKGQISDQNLISAFCILSQKPQLIFRVFQNKNLNLQGIYSVMLCIDGIWRYQIIDDLFPYEYKQGMKKLIVSRTQYNQQIDIWITLLQKAIAKTYGSYQSILNNSDIIQIILLVTGLPYKKLIIQELQEYYNIFIQELLKGSFIILQSAQNNYQKKQYYYLLELDKTKVVMRNYYKINTEQKIISYSWKQFKIMFKKTYIFKYRQKYQYVSRTIRHLKDYYSLIYIKTTEPTHCYIGIRQLSQYHFNNIYKYKYASKDYYIMIRRNNQYIYSINQTIQVNLDVGIYELYFHVNFDREYDFNMLYYGNADVQIIRAKGSQFQTIQKFFGII